MTVQITCYGALHSADPQHGEIGGNKILLEADGARLMFDFGTGFDKVGAYYNEFLRPRPARGLQDPLLLGLIPPLKGIYRTDLELPGLWERVSQLPAYRDLRRAGRPGLEAVLLSHAHLDHNGDLAYLDERIPIFATRLTAFIGRVMQVAGASSMEREFVYINPRQPNASGDLETDRSASYQLRPHYFLDGELSGSAQEYWAAAGGSSRKPIASAPAARAPQYLAGMELRWWPVDHSIPGAVGFALETPAGWVAYTGDIRFHGRAGADTQRFMQALADLHPVALICEGTSTAELPALTEADVAGRALPLLERYAGKLVIADFGARNLERFATFLELAQRSQRMLLAQAKDLYLLQTLALVLPDRPDPLSIPHLGLYADPKSAPRAWETALRQAWASRTVSPQAVSRRPGDYLLADSLWDLNDLPDLRVPPGGAYLFSSSPAYDDEQKADLVRLNNWAAWLGLTIHGLSADPAERLHASGHAGRSQLVDFVKAVQPRQLIPIHTEKPAWWLDRLAGAPITVTLPTYGLALTI
jgi:ribonuclease J